MPNDVIPEDLRDFILRHVDSVAQLEALLLLRRDHREVWDATRMAQRLYITEQQVTEVLTRLRTSGLADSNDGAFSYKCASSELGKMVDRLAETYSRHLIQITNIIHTKPAKIRQFSEAFKFKKDS